MRPALLLLFVAALARGQILSLDAPPDALQGVLGPQPSEIRLEVFQPWGLADATTARWGANSNLGPLRWSALLGAEDWNGLAAQSLEVAVLAPLTSTLDAGLALRGETLAGRSWHLVDLLLATKGPLRLGLRFRLRERTEPNLASRAPSEALGLAVEMDSFAASWIHGAGPDGRRENLLRLDWFREAWTAGWTLGPDPVQELELAWRGGRRFAGLRLRWHPYLGMGRGLVLGMRL